MTADVATVFHSQAEADAAAATLMTTALVVADKHSEIVDELPPPPYTTATLLEDATARLHWEATKVMVVAQRLFEGIELHSTHVGLITYHRTDSTAIAPEAQAEARATIARLYGAAALPKHTPQTPPENHRPSSAAAMSTHWVQRLFRRYRGTRHVEAEAVNAGEAHEAIRPTLAARLPDALQSVLDADDLALYRLIWERFVASQMRPARYRVTTVELEQR